MEIEILKIESQVNGQKVTLYPVILKINQKLFLVDCGYEESFEDLLLAMKAFGIKASELYGILISHDDLDHVGALYKFKELKPDLQLFSSVIEEPVLSGKIKSERLEQAESMFPFLPEEHKPWALEFQSALESIKRLPIDNVLMDGDVIENQLVVIHTPGHTKGHLSFYSPQLKLLIASDAFVIEGGELNIANPQFTLDLPGAVRSIMKLQSLDIQRAICYHGGEVSGDIPKLLRELVERYSYCLK